MEVETKYIAPRSAPFVALMQLPEIGGYHLEPMKAVSVRDVYLDTVAGDLLRQGYVFRVRDQDGDIIATLKSIEVAEGALHRRLELEAALGEPLADGRLPILPDGELRDILDRLVGREALQETIRIRQYRTPRVTFDGARMVGVLSLDVVAQETRTGLHVTNEVEVELSEDGREEDLYRLDPVLRAKGLEPTGQSKFERGLIRLQRDPGTALMLLPHERVALERYQESGTPLHRRRARVVLLAARGLRPATVANKAGLSPSRVQHWIEAFRAERMAIFALEAEREETLTTRRSLPAYRVSELVTGGTARPSLFRRDHFAAAPSSSPDVPEEAGTQDPFGSITRVEDLEASQSPASPVPAHTFGDGAHHHPESLTSVEPPPPAPSEPSPSGGLVEPLPHEGAARPEPSEAPVRGVPFEDEQPISTLKGVESLDDLLGLFDAGPSSTPHLDTSSSVESSPLESSPLESRPPSGADEIEAKEAVSRVSPVQSEMASAQDESVEPSRETHPVPAPDVEVTLPTPETTPVSESPVASSEAKDPVRPGAKPSAPVPQAAQKDEASPEPFPALSSPPDGPAGSERAQGSETAVVGTLSERPPRERPVARRPVLAADDPVLPSCRRVLSYHLVALEEATDRLLEQPVANRVRRMLIATHRVRIALELFADYLPSRTARRLHRGLRGTARALDALGDIDLVLAHVTDAQATASADERPAFDAVLESLENERQAASQGLALRLRGALHVQWVRRFDRLLQLLATQEEAGLAVGDHAPEEPDDYLGDELDRPQRDRMRFMLGSTLWDRYEAVRAYDAVVEKAGDELLHPLGVACSGLQFTLGLAAGCADHSVRVVAQPLAAVESHLALLHHVSLTIAALETYASSEPVQALQHRLQDVLTESMAEVADHWENVAGIPYREQLAHFVASI